MNNITQLNDLDLQSIETALNDENTIAVTMHINNENGNVDFYKMFRKYDGKNRLLDNVEALEINSLLTFLNDNGFYSVEMKKRQNGFGVLASSVGLYENYFSYDHATLKDALQNALKLPTYNKEA